MASAPTSARVRAIIFLHCLDPPSTKVRKLGRPYCDTGQAYPREGCAPSLARNCPRFARVPQFAPRAGAAVIPPNEREPRGGVSASAPVIRAGAFSCLVPSEPLLFEPDFATAWSRHHHLDDADRRRHQVGSN